MSHKSIPCPKCNRIWMWLERATPENPVCPKGYGCSETLPESSVKELLDEVLKRLETIEMKINRVTPVPPVYPINPDPLIEVTKCYKCGMEWKGVMGYVCSDMYCPVQVRTTSQTYNVSTSTGPFDIESLDPAEKSWYYDGDGTKRKKE